jgi:hypothetical protein
MDACAVALVILIAILDRSSRLWSGTLHGSGASMNAESGSDEREAGGLPLRRLECESAVRAASKAERDFGRTVSSRSNAF